MHSPDRPDATPDDPQAPLRRPDQWLPPGVQPPEQAPPAAGPSTGSAPADPGQSGTAPAEDRAGVSGGQLAAESARALRRGRLQALAALAVVLVLIVCLALVWVGLEQDDEPTPVPEPIGTPEPTISAPEGTAVLRWQLKPGTLRPHLAEPEFVNSVSGDFNAGYLAEIDGVWLVITGNENAADTELTALDPDSGSVLWRRSMDGVLCATEAPESGILCASILVRDQQTRLGTRWRLHRIDPQTGRDRATADVDAWATAVHYTADTFVLLEQRRPAPHAVVRGFDPSDLDQRWEADLSHQDGHAAMFSRNRIIGRAEPRDLDDPALDRPRFRDVGKHLVAVWAGERTAFLDRRTGKLIMMPHCTRPHDDGHRLWCNNADGGATAYSYRGRTLHRTKGVRLAYAEDDGLGRDLNRPVFYDPSGAIHSVDPESGDVLGKIVDLGLSSSYAGPVEPGSVDVGDYTFVIGEAGTVLLDPEHDKLVWQIDALDLKDPPIVRGGNGYFSYQSDLAEVDLRTGKPLRVITGLPGFENVNAADDLASCSMEIIAAVRLS